KSSATNTTDGHGGRRFNPPAPCPACPAQSRPRCPTAAPSAGDVAPHLNSTSVWSPIAPEELGDEEAFHRRADHQLPERGDTGPPQQGSADSSDRTPKGQATLSSRHARNSSLT